MFSIVTGSLNRRQILPNFIKNTLSSSNKLELIILDGGSTDGSVDYLKSLKLDNLKIIEIGGRSSYASFMNIGLEHASYDLIMP